jgi:hypothetical protein
MRFVSDLLGGDLFRVAHTLATTIRNRSASIHFDPFRSPSLNIFMNERLRISSVGIFFLIPGKLFLFFSDFLDFLFLDADFVGFVLVILFRFESLGTTTWGFFTIGAFDAPLCKSFTFRRFTNNELGFPCCSPPDDPGSWGFKSRITGFGELPFSKSFKRSSPLLPLPPGTI